MHTEEEAEKAGYEAGRHGANTTNCNFTFFATPALTKAWERGNERGIEDGSKAAHAQPVN